jgi:uncharacterized protein YciI
MSARFVYVYSMADDPARVKSVAPRHAEYWHGLKLPGYHGGPFSDRRGGLITFMADGPKQAQAVVAGDPFVRDGLLERYSVSEWELVEPSSAAPDLSSIPGVPAATTTPVSDGVESLPLALQLQVIGMEQWALLSTRSLTWTESFSRASMFLATLSGAIVGLALAAQATSFGRGFLWFALVVLAVVLFIGLATYARLVAVNSEDVLWVQGLNRLRHACLELAPGMDRYFVAASHDDEAGVLRTFGAAPNVRGLYHHVFVTTPAVVGVIDAVLAASLAATVGLLAGLTPEWAIGIALAVFLASFVSLAVFQLRSFADRRHLRTVRFPTPASAHPEARQP